MQTLLPSCKYNDWTIILFSNSSIISKEQINKENVIVMATSLL